MATPSSSPDSGPSGTLTNSSYGTEDEPPLEPEYPLGPASTLTPKDVPMSVQHFFFLARNGKFRRDCNMGASVVSSVTSVWASACEVDKVTQKPISMAARVEVHDVCPFDGGTVTVAGTNSFSGEILVRLSLLAI